MTVNRVSTVHCTDIAETIRSNKIYLNEKKYVKDKTVLWNYYNITIVLFVYEYIIIVAVLCLNTIHLFVAI